MSNEENVMEQGEEIDILTLVDDDGVEHEFELADSVEIDGTEYLALIPIFEEAEDSLDDSAELIIMRVAEENGEEFLDPVEDEEEYVRVSGVFTERLSELFEFEDEEPRS